MTDQTGTQRSTPRAEAGAAPVPDPSRQRRLVAALLLVVALAAIGLATLGASADRGPSGFYAGETEGEFRWSQQREDYSEPEWDTHDVPTSPPKSEGANTGLIISLVVAGVIALALSLWVAYRMRKLARPRPALAGLAEEDELTADQAMAALEDARTQLSTVVNAHDAVIAAWLALERAIAGAGVRRDPSQTTLEFVVAVLGSLELDRPALDRIAHLYRRALFDPQPLVEADRDEALTLLDRHTSALENGITAGGRG